MPIARVAHVRTPYTHPSQVPRREPFKSVNAFLKRLKPFAAKVGDYVLKSQTWLP